MHVVLLYKKSEIRWRSSYVMKDVRYVIRETEREKK